MPTKDHRKLTPEQRKAIASSAAKAKWNKRKEAAEHNLQAVSVPEPTVPAAAPEVPRRIKDEPVSKVFGKALAEAEKQLTKHLEDISYHEQMLAMKKARLPFLVQTIKALGGTINPEQVTGQMDPYMTAMIRGEQFVPVQVPKGNPGSDTLPPVPVARGGALGVIEDTKGTDDDMFLKGDELTGGPGWA